MQIYLRSIWSGGKLILSEADEPLIAYAKRIATEGVTHVSGTPSHWRKLLMSALPPDFGPANLRLSGEIADQGVLDALRSTFPAASIAVAYASTEAVGFEVHDGKEGFPANFLNTPQSGVAIRSVNECLQLRSKRCALGFVGRSDPILADAEGWVDTGDSVVLRDATTAIILWGVATALSMWADSRCILRKSNL